MTHNHENHAKTSSKDTVLTNSINTSADVSADKGVDTVGVNTMGVNTNREAGLEGLILPAEGCCFHCGDPVPEPPFKAFVLGASRDMCCMGCQLASESIVEAGLEQYYLDRSEINRTASLPIQLERLQAYDHDEIKSQFIYADDGKSVAELSVNNLRCAACTWLIETRLLELDGVSNCQVNLTSQRMRVIWDEKKLPISQILMTINEIGYDAKPYRQDTHEAMLERANRKMMIRLGIAALGAMQAMMYAVGMYFGDYSGMLVEHRTFLRWVSLFVSIPVFFYCAVPFFTSAWSAVKARQVNMDVPVSIALFVTFFASLYATVTGQGETYYDSVSMFVFFLLAGRYIEHNARLKAANMANDLVVVEPAIVQKIAHKPELVTSTMFESSDSIQTNQDINSDADTDTNNDARTDLDSDVSGSDASGYATSDVSHESNDLAINAKVLNELNQLGKRLHQSRQHPNENSAVAKPDGKNIEDKKRGRGEYLENQGEQDNRSETVTAYSLQVGDVIIIDAGAEVVADGILCSEMATVSQSLLTGESDLIVKTQGEKVIGGSQNDSQPFVMIVTALPENSQIALIDRLMNRAMSEKPKIAEQADKLARWFVARILLLSVVVFVGWYLVDPSQAIWATVAVLVATCPCALSLATPIALTVSTNRLASYGFLTTRGHTIQTLGEITHVAFDKTGTLTYGKPNLLYIDTLDKLQDTPNHSSKNNTFLNIDSLTKDKLLAIAAALEVGSRHPIATALLDAAYQLHLPTVTDLVHYPAGGIEAVIDDAIYLNHLTSDDANTEVSGKKTYHDNDREQALDQLSLDQLSIAEKSIKCRLGHVDFALQNEQSDKKHGEIRQTIPTELIPDLKAHQASTAVMLSYCIINDTNSTDNGDNWQPLALFYFNDSVRAGMRDMIAQLKAENITTLMLTGDPSEHAHTVASQLGIDSMENGLSPVDKVNRIKALQADGNIVMMVGDGINDAPVLAAANVSTAIAGAADLAQVSSDSVILNGAVTAVYDAKRIADKAKRIIKQNLYWALGYNAIALVPAAFGYVPPWLAAIGMSASSLLVVLNALRLKRA